MLEDNDIAPVGVLRIEKFHLEGKGAENEDLAAPPVIYSTSGKDNGAEVDLAQASAAALASKSQNRIEPAGSLERLPSREFSGTVQYMNANALP